MMNKTQKMNFNELDYVVGGTLDEVYDLAIAIDQKGGKIGEAVAYALRVAKDAGLGKLAGPANIVLREAVGKYLGSIGIQGDLSVGFLGTGLAADANKYKRNGSSITHSQVLEFIKAA